MTRLQDLQQKFNITQQQLAGLANDYKDKKKGLAYRKRYLQLVDKLEALKKQVLLYGTQGNIIEITGYRMRPKKRNPQINMKEKFQYYLVNVVPMDAHKLLEIRFKNIIEYQVRIIKPGEILTK